MSDYPGRNDPCPCGSGKKYKKCCLLKEELTKKVSDIASRKTAEAPVDSLRKKITRFMEREDFKSKLPAATNLYWRTLEEEQEPPPMDDVDITALLEWYVHDYLQPGYGKPIITLFLESSPQLPDEELQILQDWQMTNISVFQITEVEKGNGVYGEDIFTGEECFLHDISISKAIKQWVLLIIRKIWVLNEWQLSAAGRVLSPWDKEDLRDFVMQRFRAYRKKYPNATIPEFLHAKGYILTHYVLTKKVQTDKTPQVITGEGDEVVICEALFDILNFKQTIKKLSTSSEFQMTSKTDNERGEPEKYTFDWIEREEASRPRSVKKEKNRGIIVQSFFTEGPGKESWRVLGNMEISRNRLRLSVLSKERLEAGKALLERKLKSLITHRLDSIQTLDAKLQEERRSTKDTKRTAIDPEVEKQIIKDYMDKHYHKWLDDKIPALGNKSPRASSKTQEGRKKLEDLLRKIEYTEERKKKREMRL